MRIAFWGVRGSIPTPSSTHIGYGGNTACVSVVTDSGELFIFDAGSGIRKLGQELLDEAGGQPIFGSLLISHFHWDHILGLPFFMPLYRPNSHLSFFSFRHPESSLQEILELPMGNPYFPVSMGELAGQRAFYEISEQCFELGSCTITTRRLNHPQGCMGFRLVCGGRSFVYATDHEPDGGPYDRNLMELAFDADLLILDAQYTRSEYKQSHRGWGHGNWETALEIATAARVKQLVLFHHDPGRTDAELREIEQKAQGLYPAVHAAYEGMQIEVPEETGSRAMAASAGAGAGMDSIPATPRISTPAVRF